MASQSGGYFLAQGLFVNDTVGLASISILLYDYAITLTMEIEHLWCHPKKRGSFVFFVFRYSTLATMTATASVDMWALDPRSLPTKLFVGLTESQCRAVNYFHLLCTPAIQIAVSALMTQRVYAIYAKNKLILWGLITYLGLGIILTGYLMARMKAQEGSGPGTGLDLAASGSCLIYVSVYSARLLSLAWIAPMAFDLVVFTLTAYKTFGSVRRPDMPLSHLLIRDAALYFGIMVVLNAADVATYYVAQPYLRGVLGPVVNSVSVALISRMMLNLHAEAHATLEPPSLQLDTLAFASQEGRSSPNDHPSAVL